MKRTSYGLILTSTLLLIYFQYRRMTKYDSLAMQQQQQKLQQESFGTPKLGAPFILTDHDGRVFDSNEALKDKWALLYFGFTNCPDICPEELDKVGRITAEVSDENRGSHLVPLFISCDPVRDTPQAMRDYLKDFDSRIVGLSVNEGADTEPLMKTAKAFRVYFRPTKTSSENDYLLDHSIFFYLTYDNKFVKVYGRSMSSEQISKDILAEMKRHREESI